MNIFVSRPTWVAPEFEEGLRIFLNSLSKSGIVPRTLGSSDYPSKAPLDEVIEIMSQCKGAIILGYPQINIHSGLVKSNSISSEVVLPTEWNHIEAALAYSKGLPLLVIHHITVSRGVFDRGVMNAFIHSLDLTKSTWSIEPAMDGAFSRWKENFVTGNSNFSVSAPNTSGKLICPNCLTTSKPIYLSKLPKHFTLANWTCSICKYME